MHEHHSLIDGFVIKGLGLSSEVIMIENLPNCSFANSFQGLCLKIRAEEDFVK